MFNAAAATSISFFTALVSPQTVAFLTTLLISETDKNHLEIQPMISTPIQSICNNKFLVVSNLHPGLVLHLLKWYQKFLLYSFSFI
jgi:hypothetical protein